MQWKIWFPSLLSFACQHMHKNHLCTWSKFFCAKTNSKSWIWVLPPCAGFVILGHWGFASMETQWRHNESGFLGQSPIHLELLSNYDYVLTSWFFKPLHPSSYFGLKSHPWILESFVSQKVSFVSPFVPLPGEPWWVLKCSPLYRYWSIIQSNTGHDPKCFAASSLKNPLNRVSVATGGGENEKKCSDTVEELGWWANVHIMGK